MITIIGANPQLITLNSVFTDLGATAFDLEDGTITPRATGTVNTGVLGSYAITYNATDSKNLAATPKVRTVTVVPVGTSINQKPEITLLGDIIMQLTVGTAFVDPRATVLDAEDGDITSKLVATGTVNVNTIGTYTITYNATDTQNLAADQKTRTVNIVSAPTTGCTTNCGGGGSTGGSATFDYYGCINPSATNYNRLANKDDGSCVYQGGSTGGGGGGSVPLTISNEKLVVTGTTSVTVTWSTNLPSDSRVVYGMNSVASLGVKPFYGYQLTTATDTTNVYNHSMLISGIPSAIATYFRPVSSLNAEIVTGIELTRTPVTTSIGGNPLACEYLKEYLRIGVNNNPTEVTKLQLFLKNYEGATNLAVTGFFDTTTDTAVRSFQDKYKRDVLDTWNLPSNTGYVYYTTKKKINEIYCQREFPLTIEQKNEITSFRALIERINASGRVGDTTLLPIVGANKVQGSVAGVATVKTPVMITVTPSKENNTTAVNTDSDNSVEERGRIAIADLLATAPSIAEDVAGRADTHMSPEIGTDTDMNSIAKKSLLASAMSAISFRMNQCSPTTIYGTLIFLILALIFAVLYVRKQEEVKESDTAIVVETKP